MRKRGESRGKEEAVTPAKGAHCASRGWRGAYVAVVAQADDLSGFVAQKSVDPLQDATENEAAEPPNQACPACCLKPGLGGARSQRRDRSLLPKAARNSTHLGLKVQHALVRRVKRKVEHAVPVEDGGDVGAQLANPSEQRLSLGLHRAGRATLRRAIRAARCIPLLRRDHLVLGNARDLAWGVQPESGSRDGARARQAQHEAMLDTRTGEGGGGDAVQPNLRIIERTIAVGTVQRSGDALPRPEGSRVCRDNRGGRGAGGKGRVGPSGGKCKQQEPCRRRGSKAPGHHGGCRQVREMTASSASDVTCFVWQTVTRLMHQVLFSFSGNPH